MPTLKLEANNMIKKKFSLSQKSPAQAMVEFALVLPILLLVIYGLLEVGRLVFIYSSAVSAARQAARYGATTGLNVSGGVPRYQDCAGMREAAKKVGFIDRIEDADIEIQWDKGEGNSTTVYCSPGSATDPTFDLDADGCSGNNCRVRATVSTQYTPIVPLVPFTGYTISSVSARTILVSVPIVVDAGGEEWDPGAPPPPPLPSAFSKSSPSDGATGLETLVTLTWEPSTDAASYDVCYDTTNNNTCAPWADNGSSTSIQISGLATGTTYYWHVRAVNASGTTYSNGAATAFWSFTTSVPTSPPAAFNKLNPSDGAINQATSVTLSWQASAGAASYEVCFDTTTNNTCSSSWVNVGSSTSQPINGLAASTTYYWHVRAVNVAGITYSNGADTAFWYFTTAAPPPLPGAFSKSSPINGATGLETPVTLTWGTSADATSYEFCYDTTNDNACSSWVTNGALTSIQISGLAASTTYYWHVRAVNASGTTYSNGAPTAFWSFTTSASTCFTKADPLSFAPAPGALKGFWTTIYNKSGFDITMSNITITWDNSGSQKIKYLLFGSIRVDVTGNQTKSPVTLSNVNISILANGSVPLEVYFEDPYQDGSATTEEIVVNFSTSGCSPLVIR
jgi:Flp pilus assembly protein TadG